MTLGVHVLGAGFGESIVIEFPDHTVGVVDTYRHPSSRTYPLLDFLRKHPDFIRKPPRFVAITHPHADHCLGAVELVNKLMPERLLVFHAIIIEELREYLMALKKHDTPDATEAALGVATGTLAVEVLDLLDQLVERAKAWNKAGRISVKPIGLLKPKEQLAYTFGSEKCVLRCLTPGDVQLLDYSDAIGAAVRSAAQALASGAKWSPPSVNPNLISTALMLEYGSARVLLMADVEEETWEEWLSDQMTQPDLDGTGAGMLKVAHHGSRNGYHLECYQQFCGKKPLAIVTPFNKQKHQKLPSADGLAAIKAHVSEILCTNRLVAEQASGLQWEAVIPGVGPTPPDRWRADLARDSRLKTLLAPRHGGPSRPGMMRLPAAWWADCCDDPMLLHLLHPESPALIGVASRIPPYQLYRISTYYDYAGSELSSKRYVGPLAGRLV